MKYKVGDRVITNISMSYINKSNDTVYLPKGFECIIEMIFSKIASKDYKVNASDGSFGFLVLDELDLDLDIQWYRNERLNKILGGL
jgi:hypothetical protein